MPVVVEISDNRRLPTLGADPFHDRRYSLRGRLGVYRHPDQFRAGPRQRRNLLHGGLNVRGVGVGHRLHHHRGIRPHHHRPDLYRNRAPPLDLRHNFSTFSLPVTLG